MLNNANKNISFIAKRAKRSSVGILGRNLIYLYHILKINIIAICNSIMLMFILNIVPILVALPPMRRTAHVC